MTIFRRCQEVQAEMVLLKGDQPFLLHQAQLVGQGAAVDTEIRRKFLPGKGNNKSSRLPPEALLLLKD